MTFKMPLFDLINYFWHVQPFFRKHGRFVSALPNSAGTIARLIVQDCSWNQEQGEHKYWWQLCDYRVACGLPPLPSRQPEQAVIGLKIGARAHSRTHTRRTAQDLLITKISSNAQGFYLFIFLKDVNKAKCGTAEMYWKKIRREFI